MSKKFELDRFNICFLIAQGYIIGHLFALSLGIVLLVFSGYVMAFGDKIK